MVDKDAGSDPPIGVGHPATAFIGRRRERRELRAALDAVIGGRGQVAILTGEPGIGKTRLADEVALEAAAQGVQVAWGRCWEQGGAPAFWPWIQIIRSCVKRDQPETLASIGEAAASRIVEMIPELRVLMLDRKLATTGALEHRSFDSPRGSARLEQERFLLFDAIADLLKRVALAAPVLLILDDCHAADEASLQLLRFFARELRGSRIMLVATYRETEVSAEPRLAGLLGGLGREGQLIHLRGLEEADTDELIRLNGGGAASPRLKDDLYRITEGNPFFLSEIVRLMIAEKRIGDNLDSTSFLIPDEVRIAIRRRLELISEPAQEVIRTASVLGKEFEVALLSRVSPLPHEQLTEALEEATSRGVLTQVPSVIERFRFSHILIPETIYTDLPKRARMRLHQAVAGAMEEQYRETLEQHLSEIAHHHIRALPSGDANKAIDFACRAGRRAFELLAFEEGARLLKMAVEASDLVPMEQRRLCELLIDCGEAQYRGGEFDRYKSTFERAAAIARRAGNSELLARAILGYSLLSSGPAKMDRNIVTLLNEAARALGEHDSALRVRVLERLVEELLWLGEEDRVRALSDEALTIARRLGDPLTLASALLSKFLAMRGPDDATERLSLTTEMAILTDEDAARELAFMSHYFRSAALLELGDVKAARSEASACWTLPGQLRRQHLGFTEVLAAMMAMMEGRFDNAERSANEALAIALRRPNRTAQMMFATQMFLLRREQGRLAEMEDGIKGFASRSPLISVRCGLAWFYSELDRRAEAAAEFEALAAMDFRTLRRDVTWSGAMSHLAEACAFLEDQQRAQILYDLLVPYVAHNSLLGAQCFYGPVAYYLGRLATVLAHFNVAQMHFEGALQMSQAMGARPWFARTQYHYGLMLLKRGRPDDADGAGERLRSALEMAQAMGMSALAKKARSLHLRGSETELELTIDHAPESMPKSQPSDFGFNEQARADGRGLVTVLFIDAVDSTKLAAELGDRRWRDLRVRYYELLRKELAAFGGRELDATGDGLLAAFGAPGQGILAAAAIRDAVRALGVRVRAGLHAGECEWVDGKAVGITVHIGARVAASATADEVRVSSTVRDMVAGAGIGFIDRGLQTLRGVPGKWRLFSLEGASRLISAPTSDIATQGTPLAESSAIIRREPDYWTLVYGGKAMRLSHSKGLSYLAHLLRNPGREFPAIELAAAREAPEGRLHFEASVGGLLRDSSAAERVGTLGDAGEILDATAKADYKRRLGEIDAELAEAQRFNDLGRTQQLEAERDLLRQQIANALGLGGRDRKAASHSERARINVTKLIKASIRKINSNDRELGLHLANCVRTGTFCSYTPKSEPSPAWQDE